MHNWTDPITRVTKKAIELEMPITTPRIGEPVIIGKDNYPQQKWWIDYYINVMTGSIKLKELLKNQLQEVI